MTNIFFPKDIYSSSGSVVRFNCFTEEVTKYQASSFYNYEQDNLPIYDLEERTFANWERLGYYSSSIPGMVLTVSADAPASSVNCSSNIFQDVSSAVASLPVEINFPVLIEVGSFGDLGELNLNGIKFGNNGSLEIINRCFARGLSVIENTGGTFVHPTFAGGFLNAGPYSQYKYVLSALDNGDYGLKDYWNETSCVHIATPVLSASINGATQDARFSSSKVFTVAQTPGLGMGGELSGTDSLGKRSTVLTVSLSGNNPTAAGAGSITEFGLNPFEWNVNPSQDFVGPDASSYDTFQGLGSEIIRDAYAVTDRPELNVLQFGNKLSKVVIRNCNGPIYLRNFFVDGEYNNDDGVLVENSDVWLESMASVRNRKNGFYISNSKVTAARGMVAWRNYGLDGSDRITGDWSSIAQFNVPVTEEAAGLKLVNSEMILSSTSGWEANLGTTTSGILDMNHIWNFSRNTNGVVLENSVLKGGQKAVAAATDTFTQSHVTTEYSTNFGVISKNSVLDLYGRFDVHNNTRGMVAENSHVVLDQIDINGNQREGVKLVGSTMKYNKSLTKDATIESLTASLGLTQYLFSGNGQHLVLEDNSNFGPVMTSSMEDKTSQLRFFLAHGMNTQSGATQRTPLPAISIRNGSNAVFLHPNIDRDNNQAVNGNSVKGLGIEVLGRSKATLKGSSSFASRVKGPDTYANQKRVAGAYAGNNSEIEINGPTVFSDFGVDLYAENNSVISVKPPTLETGALDLSSLDATDTGNHTAVELHSTRSCVVVDKNSVLNLENLGDFSGAWGQGSNGQTLLASGTDLVTSGSGGTNIAPYINGGSIQFYPNPNDINDYTTDGIGNTGIALTNDTFTGSKGPDGLYKQYLAGTTHGPWDNGSEGVDGLSSITNGGMCVRALGNSVVDVKNVIFPCGWWNPSGVTYDSSSGDLCDRLFIWNIADGSQLRSAFVGVSGHYPTDVGYFGPSSVWNDAGAVAYLADANTPDSSSLSILDTFGIGPTTNILPTPAATLIQLLPATSENQGPFRLYFGVSPAANVLSPQNTPAQGIATQLYAQGYNPSGNLSASPELSSVFPEVLRFNDAGTALITSGWFPCSAMLKPDGSRAILDESSSNLFANAKHISTGRYGIPKKVNIYRSHTRYGSEGVSNSEKNLGRGLKSTTVFDLDRDV